MIRTIGTDIDKILPTMFRFGGGNRQEKKKTVIEKLMDYLRSISELFNNEKIRRTVQRGKRALLK